MAAAYIFGSFVGQDSFGDIDIGILLSTDEEESLFLKDPDKIGSAKYHFIVAIESCIDLCNHIISRNRFRAPDDYSDTFRVMTQSGVLPPQFTDDLIAMAKFRNRLLRLYWEVSDQQVREILKSRLGDFTRLLEFLSGYLGWRDSLI